MKIFIENWKNYTSADIGFYYEKLSNKQKFEVNIFRKKEDQIRAIFSRYLLNDFMDWHKLTENQLIVSKYGKKIIESKKIYFNISHSGKYVVLVEYNANEVGIDIEKISAYDEKIAEYCYTSYENKQLQHVEEDKKAELFIWIWTRKESYVKKNGVGLVSEEYLRRIETLARKDKVYDRKLNLESTCVSKKMNDYILSVCY